MHLIWLIPSFLVGAFFRRWWGGFLQPPYWLKKVIGFILPLVIAWPLSGFPTQLKALLGIGIAVLAVGLSWWGLGGMHGKYQRMGRGGPSLEACILWMGVNYSIYTTLAGVALAIAYSSFLPLIYAPFGFLVSLSYALIWWIWDAFRIAPQVCWLKVRDGEGGCFIDGPTSIGELFLGGWIMLGLAVSCL